MAAAPARLAAPVVLVMLAAFLGGCASSADGTPPSEPRLRPAARHPIKPVEMTVPRMAGQSSEDPSRRLNTGPNSRVTPTPDMAPRVDRTPPARPPSSRQDVEDLGRQLQDRKRWKPEEPGPPVGTIDRRPGTIRTSPGTIEIPK